jgi:glycosyltransferase involved in cell wall biosynthesis
MKVLFPIGAFYPSQSGGPANSVYWLCKGLKTINILPLIVTTDYDIGTSITRDKWLNLNFGEVIYTTLKRRNNFLRMIPTQLIYESIRNLSKVDIVHLSMLFMPHDVPIILAALIKQKPIIISPRGSLDAPALKYSRLIKKPFLFFYKLVSSKLVFHSTCDEESKYIKSTIGHKATIIQVTNFMELPEKVKLIEKRNNLLYIGRIHHKKALHLLIEALAKCQAFLASDFTFSIAGDHGNPYGKDLIKMVSSLGLASKVIFLGHVTGIQKQTLLANSYFSFIVSYTENFGLTVIESMAQGTPVVASKGTPWEILNHTNSGFWIENTVDSLVDVIDRIINMDSQTYYNMSKNGSSLTEKDFDIYKNVDLWLNAYQKVLANKHDD